MKPWAWMALLMVCLVSEGSGAGFDTQNSSLTNLIEPEPVVTMTLAQAVLRALESNLDISLSRKQRDVRITDILFEKAKFDPTVELSGRYDRSVSPLNRPIFGAGGILTGESDIFDQNDWRAEVGIAQKLPSGGDYDLTYDFDRNSVAGRTPGFFANPAYQDNLLFNLRQPLLQNYGVNLNRTQIQIAKNSAKVEQYVFVARVLEVVAEVEKAYWELVFARENAKVAQATLKAAEALLANNRARVKEGVMARVEILQAQSAVASRVEEVLIAQRTVRDQEDQLRRLLSASEEELRDTVVIVPVDPPVVTREPIAFPAAIDFALRQRPDVLQAAKNIETSHLNRKFAKNQMLPNLEFQGSMGLSGLGRDVDEMFDSTTSRRFYNMGAGLVLSYQLGNRSAKSQHHRRELEVIQAQASLQNVRQQAIVNVKEAVRRVHTDFKRMETTRVARTLADTQLKAEEERLNLGLSTTRQVVESQSDLAIARANELRAILDYNQSLAKYRRATAESLDRYGISLH